MKNLFAWLRRVAGRRYVVALEVEVQRLRAENRALLNKLLIRAGDGPLEAVAEMKPIPPMKESRRALERRLEAEQWEKLRQMERGEPQ